MSNIYIGLTRHVNVISYSHSDKWSILPFNLKPLCILDVGVKYFIVVQTLSIAR